MIVVIGTLVIVILMVAVCIGGYVCDKKMCGIYTAGICEKCKEETHGEDDRKHAHGECFYCPYCGEKMRLLPKLSNGKCYDGEKGLPLLRWICYCEYATCARQGTTMTEKYYMPSINWP